MDAEDCVAKFEPSDAEEGELEDGELVDNVDDVTPENSLQQPASHELNKTTDEGASSNYRDKKKKSKKRKREEADKAYYNEQKNSPSDCESFLNRDLWTGGSRYLGRNNQDKTPKGIYDSPGDSGEDCTDKSTSFEKQWSYQNEIEDCESPKIRRHTEKKRGRHKGKKTKRSSGNDSNYFEERCYDEAYSRREPEPQKPFKYGPNKRKKFNMHAQSNKIPPICKYFSEGKCFKGDECSFRHCSKIHKREELCKHYLAGGCKKISCYFYHGDWPCREFHQGECRDGEYCKFSHEELTEETEKLLYVPETDGGSYPNRKQSTDDLQGSSFEDKKKIPSLLDIEIFPPGFVPKRPSPTPRCQKVANARVLGAHKFTKIPKRGGSASNSFCGPSFGIDNLKTYNNDFMRPGNKCRQGWGRKPYGADWCKKERRHDEPDENEVFNQDEYSAQNFNNGSDIDKSVRDAKEFSVAMEDERVNEMEHSSDVGTNQSREDESDTMKADRFFGSNDCYKSDMSSDASKSAQDQQVVNSGTTSPDLKHQHIVQQNVFQNVQVPNVLRIAGPMMRIPPPNIMPMQGSNHRGIRLNPVSGPQPGILGAPPMGSPVAQNSLPLRMTPPNVPHHMSLPQPQVIQSTQIMGQFAPPQPPIANMLSRGPRAIFPTNMPPVNNQPFLQLPPYPPPRFDLNQIIRNIVRNTLNSQSPMFLVNPPSPMLMPGPSVNGSCIPATESTHSNFGEEKNVGCNNSGNTNLPNAKLGTDPRLKGKDDKTDSTVEENDPRRFIKDGKNDASLDSVPEIDGTAKQIEYCLKPLTLSNSKPSIPVEVLINFKDDLSSCEDPRMRSYSTSLSDLKFDGGSKLHDPRSNLKMENRKSDLKVTGLSHITLPSAATEHSPSTKSYTLPNIFIPPTSAPNIELEERALSKLRLRKYSGSGSLFSPTRDLTSLFSDFTSQRDAQLQEIPEKQNRSPTFRSPTSDSGTKLNDRSQKKVVDYRNDPRFKKKKLSTKIEESKEADTLSEVMISSTATPILNSISHEEMAYGKQDSDKSPVTRIPSPTPTFPLYCTSYQMTSLFMSNSNEELEDAESESNEESIQTKECVDCSERLSENETMATVPGVTPFLPEDLQAETLAEINLKDMFKTIDPTTSPFC